MRSVNPANPYEVYCTRCSVSFPVGTRTCVHCGQPIGRPIALSRPLEAPGPLDEDPPEELSTRALKFSPMTFVWLLAAVGTVIYRSCHGT
jgi:hypothetical protein